MTYKCHQYSPQLDREGCGGNARAVPTVDPLTLYSVPFSPLLSLAGSPRFPDPHMLHIPGVAQIP